MTPEPNSINQNWWVYTPKAAINIPPHQHMALTTPALRGPARSSQPPHNAAELPSSTKNKVYIQPKVETFQSHVLVKSSWKNPISAPHFSGSLMPKALDKGSQNTEKP